jgi:SSS family solute:Na+ symporter
MILISVAITLSLTDKHQVKAEAQTDKNLKMQIKAGWLFSILGIISLLAGIIWGTELFNFNLVHLGFNSIFLMTFMMAFLAIIMFTNAKSVIKDDKAYDFDPTLFETDNKFLFGAMGIVVIIVALYAYFW